MADVKLNEFATGTPSSSDDLVIVGTNNDFRASIADVLGLLTFTDDGEGNITIAIGGTE